MLNRNKIQIQKKKASKKDQKIIKKCTKNLYKQNKFIK